jgi:hypothetical protein
VPAPARRRLKADQYRAIAVDRLRDAVRLMEAKRSNGAVYLAGYAVECCLKACIVETYGIIVRLRDLAAVKNDKARLIWQLAHSRHELDMMMGVLPALKQKLETIVDAPRRFSLVTNHWSVHLRYDPRKIEIADAREFVDTVRELHPWLN